MSKRRRFYKTLREKIKRKILNKCGNICYYCGKKCIFFSAIKKYRETATAKNGVISWNSHVMSHTINMATIEHKIPLCLGGKDNNENKVIACEYCNRLMNILKVKQIKYNDNN